MPTTRLPERPKPPTGEEMVEDIKNAKKNDVVFLTGHALDLSDLTPTTPDGGAEGGDKALTLAALSQAERRESAQRSYHKAMELLEKVQGLMESPGNLESQFSRLRGVGAEMSNVILELQEASKHLTQQQAAEPETEAPSKPKWSKASKSNKKKK